MRRTCLVRTLGVALPAVLACTAATPAQAVTRAPAQGPPSSKADAAALNILQPAKVRTHTGVVVYRLPKRLDQGSFVFEGGEPRHLVSATKLNLAPKKKGKGKDHGRQRPTYDVKVEPLKHAAYLYWEDPTWGGRFSHYSTMLLIDAKTGESLGRTGLQYWPLVNGSAPFIGAHRFDPAYQIFSSVPGGSTGRPPGPGPQDPPATSAGKGGKASMAFSLRPAAIGGLPVAVPAKALTGECVLSIGLREDPDFSADFSGLKAVTDSLKAAGTGLQAYRSGTHPAGGSDAPDGFDLYQDVGLLVSKARCTDILIYLAGHGTAPSDGPARVLVGWKWRRVDSGRRGAGDFQAQPAYVTAADLKALLKANKKIGFKLKIDASYAGRFKSAIRQKKFPNVHVLEAGTGAKEVGYSFLSSVTKSDGTMVKSATDNPGNKLVSDPAHRGKQVADVTRGRGEFTNGNLSALRRFFTTPFLVDGARRASQSLLAEALTYAFEHSGEQDLAAQQHLTHPVFYSDQPPFPETPPAPGATVTLGSTLSPPADTTESSGQDEDFWPLSYAYCAGHPTDTLCSHKSRQVVASQATMPTDGQILAVRLKGEVVPSGMAGDPGPLTQIHFSDLRPQSDGSVKVIVTSQPFTIPSSGDPNQISTYQPTNFCVQAGDILTFSTEGGFDPTYYPQGVPFRVFGHVAGSQTAFFTLHNGVMNGAQFTGAPLSDTELLMQWDLGTGSHATKLCPGGTAG